MTDPNTPQPPNLQPSEPTLPGSRVAPTHPVTKKKSAKPWLFGGCGCLALLLVIAVVCFFYGFRFLGLNNIIKRSSGNYDPYKGALAAVLPEDLSSGLIKFHLAAKRDATSQWKEDGATEAIGFTYNQTAAGLVIKIDGALVNFPSSQQAQAVLKRFASEKKANTSAKGNGLRFSTKEGETVGWTNGSLLCMAMSGFAKPAGNFEEAAPF
jgi:hypothetical protein